jgi:hypothetical protein
VGTSAEDSEYYDVSQVVAATAWVAAKAKTAGQEKPPREIRRTYRSLLQVWNSFGHLDFDSSSDEEEDGDDERAGEAASVRDDDMDGKSDKSSGTGNSTPKGGSPVPASPSRDAETVSGGTPRIDDTGERRSKAAKTSDREGLGPMATSFHQRYPAPTPPALILPRVSSRKGGSRAGKEGSPPRSRSPVPSYRSPAEDSEQGREEIR